MRPIHALSLTGLLLGLLTPLAPAQDEYVLRGRRPIPVQEAPASTLSRGILPIDTAFVVHVDIQRLFGSTWFKAANDATGVMDEIADDDDFAEIKKEFGIDPFKDILSVTVVGHDEDGDDAVVVLKTTQNVDRALEMARGLDEYRSVAHDGFEMDSWSDGDDGVFALVFGVRGESDRRIVVGQDRDRVALVARTMLDRSPSIADVDDAHLSARPRAGSIFYLEVGLPLIDLLDETPASNIASKARRFSLDIGESKDSVRLDAEVEAATSDDARAIADVINGARSMIMLSGVLEQMPGTLADAFDDARAELANKTVRLSLSIANRDLLEGLEELRDDRFR